MNDQECNEIEQRLSAMRPADPSPALRQRVAASVQEPSAQGAGPQRSYRIGFASLAAAAVIALAGLVVLWVWSGPTGSQVAEQPEHVAPPPQRGAPAGIDDPPSAASAQPTLLALSHAWRESPQAVEQMLDQAGAQPRHGPVHDDEILLTIADARRWPLTKELP